MYLVSTLAVKQLESYQQELSLRASGGERGSFSIGAMLELTVEHECRIPPLASFPLQEGHA